VHVAKSFVLREGDGTWSQGDNVILTNDDGGGQMVSPDDDDRMTDF
jgi:hypothetical protein